MNMIPGLRMANANIFVRSYLCPINETQDVNLNYNNLSLIFGRRTLEIIY